MDEYEITWDVSATDALRIAYSRIKNKHGTAKADKFRSDTVTKVDSLRKMPTSHPLESALYHRPEKFRFIKAAQYKIIYHVVENEQLVIVVDVIHSKQDPKKLKANFQ